MDESGEAYEDGDISSSEEEIGRFQAEARQQIEAEQEAERRRKGQKGDREEAEKEREKEREQKRAKRKERVGTLGVRVHASSVQQAKEDG